MRFIKINIICVYAIIVLGCASAKTASNPDQNLSTTNWQHESQIEVGMPNIVVDGLGNIISIPKKIILLDTRIDNHSISPKTQEALKHYIQDHPKFMQDTKVRINQFAPVGEFKRLIKNKKVRWWWRIFPGIPVTFFSLGGRLFGGDHYNPFTDTIHLYSDITPVALHEAGHAADTAEKVEEGWADYYILGRVLPVVALHQELVASEKAVHHLEEKNDKKEEKNAYRILVPAYGTYVGGSSGLPYGDVIGALAGHVVSLVPRYNTRLKYEALENAKWDIKPVIDLDADPVKKNLKEDNERRERLLIRMIVLQEKESREISFPISPFKGGLND